MARPNRSEFVDLVLPLHDRLGFYDPSSPPLDQAKNDSADPAKGVPQGFIDAMIVREKVYVKEQKVPLANELDDDDKRSFHWIAYASIPDKTKGSEPDPNRRSSTSTKIPIGTIRLVPPPHSPHHGDVPGADHAGKEAYVKLGRLAVIKEFRKAGISKLLIETALKFAREQPGAVSPQLDPASVEILKRGVGVTFKGLVLVHSQTGVEKVWRRHGFEKDETMGIWDEEGIDHIGMWKRVDVAEGRRKSYMASMGP